MWTFEWQTSFAFRRICFLSFVANEINKCDTQAIFVSNSIYRTPNTSKTNVWYLNALDWSNKWGSSCMRLSTNISSPSHHCLLKCIRLAAAANELERARMWLNEWANELPFLCVLSFVISLYHVSWISSNLIRKPSRLRKWCVWNKLIRKSHHSQQPFEWGEWVASGTRWALDTQSMGNFFFFPISLPQRERARERKPNFQSNHFVNFQFD